MRMNFGAVIGSFKIETTPTQYGNVGKMYSYVFQFKK